MKRAAKLWCSSDDSTERDTPPGFLRGNYSLEQQEITAVHGDELLSCWNTSTWSYGGRANPVLLTYYSHRLKLELEFECLIEMREAFGSDIPELRQQVSNWQWKSGFKVLRAVLAWAALERGHGEADMTKHFSIPTTLLSLMRSLHLSAATTKPGVAYLLPSTPEESLCTDTGKHFLFFVSRTFLCGLRCHLSSI